MEKVRLSKGATAYEDLNPQASTTVFFLHGGTIPSWCYDHVFMTLKDSNLRLVRYDMYGRGESDCPKISFTREDYLDQVEELIKVLKIEKIDLLVGASFGASVGTLFCLKNPDLVKRIAYISPAVNWIRNTKIAYLLKLPLLGKGLYETIGKKRIKKRALGFIDLLPSEHRELYRKRIEAQFADSNTCFWSSLFLQLSGKALSSYVRQYKALAAMNKHQVELIWGAGDREVSSRDVDFLKSSFEKIDVFEVRGSGHGLMAESPELVTDFIQKNISKLSKMV